LTHTPAYVTNACVQSPHKLLHRAGKIMI